MDTKMSGTQDVNAPALGDSCKDYSPQPEHVPLQYELELGEANDHYTPSPLQLAARNISPVLVAKADGKSTFDLAGDRATRDAFCIARHTKPAVKLSRLLRPYFTVRSCYSTLSQT